MKTITLRLSEEIYEALKVSAERGYRSVNGEILHAITDHYLKFFSNLSRDEVEHLFYNKPDYKQLAKERKEKIKALEEAIWKLENPEAKEPVDVTGTGIWKNVEA